MGAEALSIKNEAPVINLNALQHTFIDGTTQVLTPNALDEVSTVGTVEQPDFMAALTSPVEAVEAPIEADQPQRRDGNVARIVRRIAFGTPAVLALAPATVAVASPAAVARNKAAAPTTWSHLGGDDPLVRGGLKNTHDFVQLVTSKKGHTALRLQGLNTTEIKAADKAARKGQTADCTMHVGDKFASMVFGINGASIDRNVTFSDQRFARNGAPAKCLTVTIRDKDGRAIEKLTLEAPMKCANLSVKNLVELHPVKPKAPVAKKPAQPAPEVCSGDVNQANNSGVDAKGGNCSVVTNVNTCTANYSPNAIVCSPQVPPQIPPVDKGHAPTINLQGLQHALTGDIVRFCAIKSDVDGDAGSIVFSEQGGGEFVSFNIAGNDPNEECVDWKAGFIDTGAPDEIDTITATVEDSQHHVASDAENITVTAGQPGQGQF